MVCTSVFPSRPTIRGGTSLYVAMTRPRIDLVDDLNRLGVDVDPNSCLGDKPSLHKDSFGFHDVKRLDATEPELS